MHESVQEVLRLAGLSARELPHAAILQFAWTLTFDLLIIETSSLHQQTEELCQQLRRFFGFPILLLERGATEQERIAFLDAGADDVLAFPHGLAELPSRCTMLLRRVARQLTRDPDSGYLRAAALRLDIARCRLLLQGGAGVDLTSAQTRLLALLLSAQGACVAAPIVSQHVFGVPAVNVSNRVAKILRDLEARVAPFGVSPFVDYVKGHGYRILLSDSHNDSSRVSPPARPGP